MATLQISPELSNYLNRKGVHALVAELAECKTCGGAIAEVYVRVARKPEVQRLFDSGCARIETDDTALFLNHRNIRADDTVELGLRGFLGIKDITVSGLHL